MSAPEGLKGRGPLWLEPGEHKNTGCAGEGERSRPDSRVKTYVVATNVKLMMTRKARDYLIAE